MMLFGSREVFHGDISVFAGNYSFLAGAGNLKLGCARSKFGVCVPEKVVVPHLEVALAWTAR